MAYDEHIRRYSRWYARLLRFYPRDYREQMLEPMQQTFNDLLRERAKAQQGLSAVAWWTFADTARGIIHEDTKHMTRFLKDNWQVAFALTAAFAVIGAAWWLNGSEREDAWLYIFCVWLILYSAYEVYATWKKNHDKR